MMERVINPSCRRQMSAKKLNFQFSYQVRDVSPLPHYYEEIISHTKQLSQIGLRGDRNYMFHSKDGLGTAYYEADEARLSAEHNYKFFSDTKNRQQFFIQIDNLLGQIKKRLNKLSSLELDKLPDSQLYEQYISLLELDSWAFTYFLASQPYKLQLFEDEAKAELRKKVAASRVDEYLAQLALSQEPTRVSEEEKDWLELIIWSRQQISPAGLDINHLKQKHPELYEKINSHYQKYGTLSLGDGVWNHSINYFIDNLRRDYPRDIKELKTRYLELKNFKSSTFNRRRQLIKELELSPRTISTIEFLAEMGRYRFNLRVEGFMPVIYLCLKTLREIERRLGVKGYDLMFLIDEDELRQFYSNPTKQKLAELRKRVPKNMEYLLLLKDGKYSVFLGKHAATEFKKYIETNDRSKQSEVAGNVAMRGKVQGTATVYMWGDDLNKKLKEIKKHPILIAGHTRPAMMPLIRESIGIVTDEGGITSHAAIVSRELGLPSVINTKHATKVFKTGDKVELDAENGIVRKL
ncbi:MAG TPA: PEP-utilizing enzyme [Candidatus Saccharimonadales bacterium]|nr:PEP-utilizing enzyme [Candidatus Saccharimonadales bacterium]